MTINVKRRFACFPFGPFLLFKLKLKQKRIGSLTTKAYVGTTLLSLAPSIVENIHGLTLLVIREVDLMRGDEGRGGFRLIFPERGTRKREV